MSLVFSAITPHPPIIIRAVGRDHADSLKQTRRAFDYLSQELYAAHPDILVIITPHGQIVSSAWQILVGDELAGNLNEFSDFATSLTVSGSVAFSHRFKERAEDNGFTVLLQSDRLLDYGCVIPLLYLVKPLPKIRVVPLIVSDQDLASHHAIGKMLREEIYSTNERVAVIASADLSHRLTKQSPGGFQRNAKGFDQSVIRALERGDSDMIVKQSPEVIENALACGLRPISVLLGTWYRRSFRSMTLAYEYPFGVGYLTALIAPG